MKKDKNIILDTISAADTPTLKPIRQVIEELYNDKIAPL